MKPPILDPGATGAVALKSERSGRFRTWGSLWVFALLVVWLFLRRTQPDDSSTILPEVSQAGSGAQELLEVPPVVADSSNVLAVGETGVAARHPQVALKDRWGIQIASVRLTAGGRALDVRYRVLDVAKASGMHAIQTETYLLDAISGKNLSSKAHSQPLVSQELVPGKTYFMMFPNSGGLIRKGGVVTLVVAGVRTEGLVVE
jgi:hypothetical protein